MVLYLLTLVVMAAGASALAFLRLQSALWTGRVSVYDARGFFFVIMVFITFALTSLAYFWGESRFNESLEQADLHPAVIGSLINLVCCTTALGAGLFGLKKID